MGVVWLAQHVQQAKCIRHQKAPTHPHVQHYELGKVFNNNIKERTGEEILMMGEEPPELNAVSLKGKLVWVKIATVLDSGAYRRVTPNGGHNYYGPAGDPIKNLGRQLVTGASEARQELNIPLNVVKITRPQA